MEHSPLPWRVRDEDGSIGTIEDARSSQVAQAVQVSPLARDLKQVERRANAALIVRAVNSHEKLVAALKYARDRLELADEGRFDPATLPMINEALAAAEAQ